LAIILIVVILVFIKFIGSYLLVSGCCPSQKNIVLNVCSHGFTLLLQVRLS